MLGPPIDAWYVWVAVSLVALAVLGVAAAVAPTQPSKTPAVAETIDTVAASEPPASGHQPIDADRVLLEPHRVTVGGETTTLDVATVTPAQHGTSLRAVALGAPMPAYFDDPDEFHEAAAEARAEKRVIEPAGDELVVRTYVYNGTRTTLVTA